MKNVDISLEGNIMTIVIDLSQDYGPSSTGKTKIVASTEGAQPLLFDNSKQSAKLNLTVYKPL